MQQYLFRLSTNNFVNELSMFVDEIKESWEAHRNLRKFGHIELSDPIETIDNIRVHCSDKAVALSGVARSIPGTIRGTDSDGNNVVVLNRRMLDQDRWFIDGAIAHEIGHIRLHDHAKRPIINKLFSIVNNDQLELEADDYAFDLGHNMLRVLNRYKRFGYRVERRIGHMRSRTF